MREARVAGRGDIVGGPLLPATAKEVPGLVLKASRRHILACARGTSLAMALPMGLLRNEREAATRLGLSTRRLHSFVAKALAPLGEP